MIMKQSNLLVAAMALMGLVKSQELLYVMDIVNHGSALPVQYMNFTGVSYDYTGPG
jgi:hypothetical protein